MTIPPKTSVLITLGLFSQLAADANEAPQVEDFGPLKP